MILTTVEAAEYLKVVPKTIQENARAGKIPGAKVGKEWRFLKEALDRYVAGEDPCQLNSEVGIGISTFQPDVEDEYDALLGLE